MIGPKQDTHPLITSQIANATLLTIQIEVAAKRLAQMMDELHGHECRFSISHKPDEEMIVISTFGRRGGSSRG